MVEGIEDFLVYLKTEKGLSPDTQQAYRSDLMAFWNFLRVRGEVRLDQIGIAEVVQFLESKKMGGYRSSSIYRALVAIKVFFCFFRREQVSCNPLIMRLEAPKIWQLVPDCVTQEEAQALLEVPSLNTLCGVRDRAILETLYGCGLRVSELCRLRIQDVGDASLLVRGKGNKERLLPIGQEALFAIDRYLCRREDAEPALFLSMQGKPLDRISVWKIVKQHASQIGLSRISPHTFRHSYATHLLQNGADLRVIQELLGHADIASTDRYTRTDTHRLQQAFAHFHPRP